MNGFEKSILDFFIICDIVRPFFSRMVIDEEKENCLTNFNPAKKGMRVKESDHNPLIMDFVFKVIERKTERLEFFNFKNKECQETFYNLTDQTKRFTECFENDLPFEEQAKNWERTLNSFFHQSFKKVRMTEKRVVETKVSKLLEKRKELKLRKKKNQELDDEDLDNEFKEIEKEIAEECSEENRKKVIEGF